MGKLLASATKAVAALGVAALVGTPLLAQIYRSVDEQGNVVFSDQPPPPGTPSEEVELGELNTTPPPATPSRATRQTTPAEAPPEPTVTITAPENEATIAMGPGNFSVSASVSPPLRAGEALQLRMDGEPVGEPRREPSWSLTGVLRGPHDLVLRRVDAAGNTVAESEAVRVFVLRPSIQ